MIGPSEGRFAQFNRSLVGRSLSTSFMESIGVHHEGWGKNAVSKGFLGHKMHGGRFFSGDWAAAGKGTLAKSFGKTGRALSFGGTMAGRLLAPAFSVYEMYAGYQEEGVWGAAKGLATSVGYGAITHYAFGALGGMAPVAMAGAGIAAAGYATYKVGESAQQHAKSLRQLEMGQQDQMQAAIGSAGAATMRQRSLMALNNTHLNGRMSLGNEGFLMHRGFGGY